MRMAVISAMALGALSGAALAPSADPQPRFLRDLTRRAQALREKVEAEEALRKGRSFSGERTSKIDPHDIDVSKLSAGTKRSLRQFWRDRQRLEPKIRSYWSGNLRKMGHGAVVGGVAGGTLVTAAFTAHELAQRRKREKKGKKKRKK